MSQKNLTIIFSIVMIIFLPLSYYLIQEAVITKLIRNIIFAILIIGYLLIRNTVSKINK